MSGETISVSPALLWRLRVGCLTWQALGRGDGRISGSCRPPGCFAKIWVLAIANCSLQGTDLRSQYYSSS